MSASLAGVMDVEVPDTLITNTAREKYAQMMAEFRGSGMDDDQIKKLITPENFLKYKDIEKADIEKDFKTSMATDEIARLENIEVPSYQVEEQLEAVRKEADGEDLGDEGQLRSKIESTLMRRLVFDFLADNAELEVEYVEEEEFDEKMLEELAEQTMQREETVDDDGKSAQVSSDSKENVVADDEGEASAEVEVAVEPEVAAHEEAIVQETSDDDDDKSKSPEDEEALQEKYAAMDPEERAYNILLDLDMIAVTPDPESADYDHSNDDELAQ